MKSAGLWHELVILLGLLEANRADEETVMPKPYSRCLPELARLTLLDRKRIR